MGKPNSQQCSSCQATLPKRVDNAAPLKFCPYCGKPIPEPVKEPSGKSPKKNSHFQSMEQVVGGYVLSLGDDPIAATPASVSAQENTMGKPAVPSFKNQTEPESEPFIPELVQDVFVPSIPEDQAEDADADLLSLDLDLARNDEANLPKFPQSKPQTSKPQQIEQVDQTKIKPASAINDATTLPMLDEPVMAHKKKTPDVFVASLKPANETRSDDTLAGLQDEEDCLDLARAEEVVDLTVESDDTLMTPEAGGLVATDATDDDEFELDYDIKPEESAPVAGLNMLQQQVGRASSWDRVPLPELAAASDQSSVYDLAVEPEVASGKVCPSCNANMSFDAVVCSGCGYNVQLGRPMEGLSGDPMGEGFDGSGRYVSDSEKYDADQEYYHKQHLLNDIYIPSTVLLASLVFLLFTVIVVCPYEMVDRLVIEAVVPNTTMPAITNAPAPASNVPGMGGIAMNFMAGMAEPPPPPPLTLQQKWFCIAYLFGTNLLEIAIKIPFMFFGMMIVIRLFGVSFGGVVTAITKLLAIAMATHVITFFVQSVLFILTEGLPLMGLDVYITFPFAVITFIGLNIRFFDLDIQEAVVLYLSSYLLPIFVAMLFMMWVVSMVM